MSSTKATLLTAEPKAVAGKAETSQTLDRGLNVLRHLSEGGTGHDGR